VNSADTTSEIDDERSASTKRSSSNKGGGGGGSPLYALGVIGALVWFWNQASDDPAERVIAVLKALVWPAILVHHAFEALSD
jgi:hypothetical protein